MSSHSEDILVTGAAGFIGSEFVRQAIQQGFKVTVVDKLTYAGDLARLAAVQGRFTFVKADICDPKKIQETFKKVKPDIVVHFAAETHVDRSILDTFSATRTNMIGTQNLIETAKKSRIEKFIHISTDEVYGDIHQGQFTENSPVNPSSPYSAAKAAADVLLKAYIRTYKFPAIIVRPSNNYGPWQYPEKFMPVIIYKAMTDQKIPVYGQGLNVREWLYVSDCVSGIMKVLENGRLGEVYNLGSGHEYKNIDVVRSVLDILNKPLSLIEYVQDRPGHDFRYSLDFSKLKNELGWEPLVNFPDGVRKTVDFYQQEFAWLEKKVAALKSYWKKVYKKI